MNLFWIIVGIAVVVLVALTGNFMSNVEEPEYQVVLEEKRFEVRKYPSILVARVVTEGERGEAINQGFRLLADYIFGKTASGAKIRMTAPVVQQEESIGMTAPVTQSAASGSLWTTTFAMPSKYTMESIPKPRNNQIKLVQVPERYVASVVFRGRNTDENIYKYRERLIKFTKRYDLKLLSQPEYAFYNPPWTLPFLRRNEVLVEVEKPQQ